MTTRMRRRQDAAPLSPAWRWSLMTGTLPTARIPGWVEQAQAAMRTADDDWDYTATGDALWQQHREALVAEAKAANFVPFWLAQQEPAGPGFRQWREAFLSEHTY